MTTYISDHLQQRNLGFIPLPLPKTCCLSHLLTNNGVVCYWHAHLYAHHVESEDLFMTGPNAFDNIVDQGEVIDLYPVLVPHIGLHGDQPELACKCQGYEGHSTDL